MLLALPLYALLVLLGGISLAWNLVAMLLYPVLPARTRPRAGPRVHRAGLPRLLGHRLGQRA